MGTIRVLPPAVADQIAAGEVVERPASIVKELVENALDAGATTIRVDLENGGRALIRVADDGSGMDAADAELAMARHATSKISAATDLVGVSTYGFRGEALPAIASVSHFEIATAAAGADAGTQLAVRGGAREGSSLVARARGTTVTVRNVFFNTPARRKFLRSQRSETRAVSEAVTVLALARPDVAFRLESDGRTLIDAPPAARVLDRVVGLFGRQLAETLLAVEYASGYVMVRGFVTRPAEVRTGGRKAYLFVNGRPFKDPFLLRAAEAGYRGTIPQGHRPTVLLSLTLPGDRVDVNVHPAKAEVRFRDKMFVEQVIEEAVRASLQPLEASAILEGAVPGMRRSDAAFGASPFDASPWGEREEPELSLFDTAVAPAAPAAHDVLQIFNTYIVFETGEGVAIVDQHSAHERILYEQVMGQLTEKGSASQRLLLPLTVDLNVNELDAIEAHAEFLAGVGFEVEPFGGRSVVLHAVPNPHPRFDARRCFEEMVTDLARDRFGAIANRLERFAATFGCRAAIKAGQRLEHSEMRDLLGRLFACDLPPHDVHGRPTIVQLPKGELERRFGRS